MIRNVSAVENTIKPQIDTTRTANLNFETLNTHSSRKEINNERNIKIKSGEGFPSHQPSQHRLNPLTSSIGESEYKKVRIKHEKPRVKSANQYVSNRVARTLVSRGGRNESLVSNSKKISVQVRSNNNKYDYITNTVRSASKYGKLNQGEYQDNSTQYTTHQRHDGGVVDGGSITNYQSSRKIGCRVIPSIDYNEPLVRHRPYSSSQTAKLQMGLAHRKYAAEVTSRVNQNTIESVCNKSMEDNPVRVQNLIDRQKSSENIGLAKDTAHVLSGHTILQGYDNATISPRIKVTDRLRFVKNQSPLNKFQTIDSKENYNERYNSELNPKHINFRAKNVLTGSQMKIHKDEKMGESINAVLQAKSGKNKSTANNYCVFYSKAPCPTQ